MFNSHYEFLQASEAAYSLSNSDLTLSQFRDSLLKKLFGDRVDIKQYIYKKI